MSQRQRILRTLLTCSTFLFVSEAIAQTAVVNSNPNWAGKIGSIPCVTFTERGHIRDQRWLNPANQPPDGSAPFGVPYLEWTTPLFNVLKDRVRACGNPAIDGDPNANYGVHAMDVIGNEGGNVMQAERVRREREQQAAANTQMTTEMERIAKLPGIQQIPLLQQLASGTNDRQMRERIQIQIERAQNLAAVQAEADRRTADAAAAEQRLATTQRNIEQGRRDAELRRAEIERERAALSEQTRRTEAAQHEAETAGRQAAQLQQQQAALAPAQTEVDRQRERDEAELRQLREQRASLEEQRRVAQEQTAQNREQVEARNLLQQNGDKLVTMGFPPALLDGTVMLPNGNGGYGPFVTLRQFLSVLLAGPGVSLTSVNGFNGTRPGFAIKRPGAPSTAILFRPDGSELYLDSIGEGDRVSRLRDEEAMPVTMLLVTAYQNALKGALSAAH